jgi:hypothetical protein
MEAMTGCYRMPFSILINPRIYIKSFLGIACAVSLMAAKEKRLTTRSEIPNPQATGQSELPLREEFVAETLQAISELDRGLAKAYSSKKEFLDNLERL